jgi:hypothetical protein
MRVVVAEIFGTGLTSAAVVLLALGLATLGKSDVTPCRNNEASTLDYLYYANEVWRLGRILVAGRLMSYLIVRKCFSFTNDAVSTADNLYSIVFHSYLSYLACYATLQLHGDVESRWKSSTYESQLYMLLFVVDNTIHLPLQAAKDTPTGKNMSVITHHVLSNLCYCVSLASGRMHFWACLAGVSEVTNPPLSLVFIMKECGWQGGAVMGRLFQLASLLVWVSFFIFRCVLFPAWLVEFATDHYFNYLVVVCVSTLFERAIFVAVIAILLALSVSWMVPLTRGLQRTLFYGVSTPQPHAPRRPSRRGKRGVPATEKRGAFSRAQGASSGAESYLISMILMGALMILRGGWHGWHGAFQVPAATLLLQLAVMSPICRNMLLVYCFSMKLGPATMRNAALGFAQCVRPGGKPTSTHCLDMFHLPAFVTGFIWFLSAVLVLMLGPITALIRPFYPEHSAATVHAR